jgi:zeta-carotene desaturase
VAAVPHDVLLKMAPEEMTETNGQLAGLQHIKTSPITGVHFWFDRKVMTVPFLALLDHTVQWVFNKSLLYALDETAGDAAHLTSARGEPSAAECQYLQLVISASYDLVARSRQDIIDLCLKELKDVLPATREAKLLRSTVIKEVNATFSPAPGVDRWRPAQETTVKNFFLAGDWTRTGWPSTMEGAVRSGYLAAEALLASFGQPRKLLQPDLPLEGFCKIWGRQKELTPA